jgi:hypothetical protein
VRGGNVSWDEEDFVLFVAAVSFVGSRRSRGQSGAAHVFTKVKELSCDKSVALD